MIDVRLAPGHARQTTNAGTGLEWCPDEVRLWEYDPARNAVVVTRTASHRSESAWAFFESLAYRDLFPEVTHWWFGGAWTQRVAMRPLKSLDAHSVRLLARFGDADDDRGALCEVWLRDRPVEVEFSRLPLGQSFANLPLVIALSRLVIGVLYDESPQTGAVISSLVPREAIGDVLSLEPDIVDARTGRTWRVQPCGSMPLRTYALKAQGLRPVSEAV